MIKGLRLYLLPAWTAVLFFVLYFGVEIPFWILFSREPGPVDYE